MPGGDGTGPVGMGPMTGRAVGYCAGYPAAGFMNTMPGRGSWGWGQGRGGWRHRNRFYANGLTGLQQAAYSYPDFGVPYGTPYNVPFAPAMTSEREVEMLKGQAEYFEDALDGIKKRIDELEAKTREK